MISTTTFALVNLKNVTGTSYFDTSSKIVYAGFAGTCAGPVSSSTCNTCTDTSGMGLKPCNQKAIHPALNVVFSFTSSVDLTNASVGLFIGADAASSTQVGSLITGAAASTDMTLSTTWSTFCNGATGLNSDCSVAASSDKTVTNRFFFIGADESRTNGIEATEKQQVTVVLHSISASDTTLHSQPFCSSSAASGYGLCSYALETGDSKLVILGDPAPLSNSTPPNNSPAFQAVVFFPFIQATGISVSGISNGKDVQPMIKNFTSATDLSLEGDPYITGLTNFERYCVFAGQMNLAQNIFGFTTTSLDASKMCKETSEVVGLLDDKHCFISTAAFGSDMATEVQIFRQFRNTFLLTNKYGAEFVKFYYDVGPKAALFISDSEFLKSITRAALYPLVGFSWIALNYGILPALLFLLLTLICIFNFRKKLSAFFASRKFREKFN